MAYDSARGVTVTYGGFRYTPPGVPGFGAFGGTHLWNGVNWQRPLADPFERCDSGMAFDSGRGVAVLFGGAHGGVHGDTWEWDGSNWTQRQVVGPLKRLDHAMAFDSARGVTVLFGGLTVEDEHSYRLGDTWEWNGSSWIQRVVAGPSPRDHHAMAYDSARGVTVLFGPPLHGVGETWEWDGYTWEQRQVAGPTRVGHAMCYDSARGVTVLFGGGQSVIGGPSFGDTWEWDGMTWTHRVMAGPTPRRHHAMAYDSAHQAVVLFAGSINGWDQNLRDTWELQLVCYADCDGDTLGPTLTIADFSCFLQKYAAGNPYANCDSSTTSPNLNVADFSCFLHRFATGCP